MMEWMGKPPGEGGERTEVDAPELKNTDAAPRKPLMSYRFERGATVGRYMILERLGGGGMGVVYIAFDPELDRKIAIKLLRPGAGKNVSANEGRTRLLREAQAMARLSHPNVIAVHDVGTFGDEVFVAMELVEGVSLAEHLKTCKPDLDATLSLFLQAGRGLAAAHAAGLIHRDFKPENVLVGKDGRVRVLDFGLARAAGVQEQPAALTEMDHTDLAGHQVLSTPITRTGAFMGTPAYMAPEQMSGHTTDARTDQFSFCVSLYEAVYGERPFAGDNIATLVAHVMRDEIRPAPRDSHVPATLRAVILRGLSHRHEQRFPSMEALLEALRPREAPRSAGWWMVAAVIPLAVAAGLVAYSRHDDRKLCRGAERKLTGVWDDARKQAMHTAFAAAQLPYGESAFDAVSRALDEYTRAWTSMHVEACEATRVRGEQSDAVLDLRMSCLDRRLGEVAALSSLLATADAATVKEAPRAVSTLSKVADCADVAALKVPAAARIDPAKRTEIDAATKRLAEIKALYSVGKVDTSIEAANKLLAELPALSQPALEAETLVWIGRANADLDRPKESIPAFHRAFATALRGRADDIATDASIRLAQEYFYGRDRAGYDDWRSIATALLDRVGTLEHKRSFLEQLQCVALWQEGVVKRRLDCLEKHAAKLEREQPLTEWELTTLGLAASDAGQFEKGVAYARRGVAYSAEHNGADHPRTLEMRAFLIKSLIDFGDSEAAVKEGQATLERILAVAPNDKYLRAKADLYLGTALSNLRRDADARPHLEAALAEDASSSEATVELAKLASRHGQHKDALKLAREGLATDEKTLRPEHPNIVWGLSTLGEAELRVNDAAAALPVLERANQICDHADLSPYMIADARFLLARALFIARPAEQARARTLAETAQKVYERAPPTPAFDRERKQLASWLADPRHFKPGE
jgi:hypothetical protein